MFSLVLLQAKAGGALQRDVIIPSDYVVFISSPSGEGGGWE